VMGGILDLLSWNSQSNPKSARHYFGITSCTMGNQILIVFISLSLSQTVIKLS